uniref:DUF281 domain-containing protein n=1 Tax=Caenorhabditis tropicalis TaxID=1561998 RepID=A0A1I7TVL1_9PELO
MMFINKEYQLLFILIVCVIIAKTDDQKKCDPPPIKEFTLRGHTISGTWISSHHFLTSASSVSKFDSTGYVYTDTNQPVNIHSCGIDELLEVPTVALVDIIPRVSKAYIFCNRGIRQFIGGGCVPPMIMEVCEPLPASTCIIPIGPTNINTDDPVSYYFLDPGNYWMEAKMHTNGSEFYVAYHFAGMEAGVSLFRTMNDKKELIGSLMCHEKGKYIDDELAFFIRTEFMEKALCALKQRFANESIGLGITCNTKTTIPVIPQKPMLDLNKKENEHRLKSCGNTTMIGRIR